MEQPSSQMREQKAYVAHHAQRKRSCGERYMRTKTSIESGDNTAVSIGLHSLRVDLMEKEPTLYSCARKRHDFVLPLLTRPKGQCQRPSQDISTS